MAMKRLAMRQSLYYDTFRDCSTQLLQLEMVLLKSEKACLYNTFCAHCDGHAVSTACLLSNNQKLNCKTKNLDYNLHLSERVLQCIKYMSLCACEYGKQGRV